MPEEKPCRLCEILYDSKMPNIESLPSSHHFLAVMQKLPQGMRRIFIIPKDPEFSLAKMVTDTEIGEIEKEGDALLVTIREKLEKEYKSMVTLGRGLGVAPCERGKEVSADGKKFHQCIIILIMERE